MAKNQNTFAKQQREVEKKRKAQQKRIRRLQRKEAAGTTTNVNAGHGDDPSEPG